MTEFRDHLRYEAYFHNVILQKIFNDTHKLYIPAGINIPSLDRHKKWFFAPILKVSTHSRTQDYKEGNSISGGDPFGKVIENGLNHLIMLPHGEAGNISWIAQEGIYTITEVILKINDKSFTMIQNWPIRRPRPYANKLDVSEMCVTGYRVFDSLFPCALGGTCCLIGSGTGKTVITRQIIANANVDCSVSIVSTKRGGLFIMIRWRTWK